MSSAARLALVFFVGFAPLLLGGLFFFGDTAHAALVTCGNGSAGDYYKLEGGEICYYYGNAGQCTFCDISILAQNILNFLVASLMLVAAILFVNAGVLYVTGGGNAGTVSKAHRIFVNTVIGLVIVVAAWLVVDVVMKTLVNEGSVVLNGRTLGPWNDIICKDEMQKRCIKEREGVDALVPAAVTTPQPVATSGAVATGALVGGGVCKMPSNGPCSVAALSAFGANAARASQICLAESGNNPSNRGDKCVDGNYASWGMFQINISANNVNGVPCHRAFNTSARGSTRLPGRANVYNCRVIDSGLYNQCVTMMSNPAQNIQQAMSMSGGGRNFGAWSTASKCGIRKI